jgi:hypothetical protein
MRCCRLNHIPYDFMQALLKALVFFTGAVIVARNFGDAFAV